MACNLLTDSQIKTAIKEALAGKLTKPRKLFDGEGLFLLITPTGSALWRFGYVFNGKAQQISLGRYPERSLSEAREQRLAARKLVANGVNPSAKRKAEKAARAGASSFEAVAREWLAQQTPRWAEANASRIVAAFENDILPRIGKRPIAELQEDAPAILATVRRIANRGALDSAHRALQYCGRVFRYGIATVRATRDPTRDLLGALPAAVEEHFPAIVEPKAFGALLRAIWGYQGYPVVMAALKLAPLLFVRPGELRAAEWAEMHLDDEHPAWKIPAVRMKARREHIVPLAAQCVEILRELEPVTGNGGRLVFPGVLGAGRPISDNTVNSALRRLGYDGGVHVAHGFRSSAATLLREEGFCMREGFPQRDY